MEKINSRQHYDGVGQPCQVPPGTVIEEQVVPQWQMGKGLGKLAVQQTLLGLRPARYRDAVRLRLHISCDDVDYPTSLMEVMELQLDILEAVEETLGAMVTDRVTGELSARAKAGSSGEGCSAAQHENYPLEAKETLCVMATDRATGQPSALAKVGSANVKRENLEFVVSVQEPRPP